MIALNAPVRQVQKDNMPGYRYIIIFKLQPHQLPYLSERKLQVDSSGDTRKEAWSSRYKMTCREVTIL